MRSDQLLAAAALAAAVAAQDTSSDPTLIRVPTQLVTRADRPAVASVGVETFRQLTIPLRADAGRDNDPVELADALAAGFDTRGVFVRLAVAWKDGEPIAQYGVDADGDGRIVGDEVRAVAARVSKAATTGTPRVQFEVPLRQTLLGRPFGIQIRRLDDGIVRAEISCDIDYRQGVTDLAGTPHTLLVMDNDDDGRFGSPGDHFAFLASADHAKVNRFGVGRGVSFPATDAAILGQRRVRLLGFDADGVASLRLEAPSEPVAAYLARRRSKAVDGHRASLAAQAAGLGAEEGFDPEAPPAATQIAWQWVLDADAAVAAARAAGTPLFLVYEQDTDERCAMMDLWSWNAPEVVEALAGLTCARVSMDLDVAQTWRRYDVRFGPAYVFVHPDGQHLQFTDRRSGQPVGSARGFKAPKAMAAFVREQRERLERGDFAPVKR